MRPISRRRSSRYAPAVMGASFGCSPAGTHWANAARLMCGTGCQKNGMLKRGLPQSVLGGLTTRWVVDLSSWLVSR